jgi:hypothetical protein
MVAEYKDTWATTILLVTKILWPFWDGVDESGTKTHKRQLSTFLVNGRRMNNTKSDN